MKKRQWGLIDGFLIIVLCLSALGLLLRIQLRSPSVVEDAQLCTVLLSVRACPSTIRDCIAADEVLYCEDGSAFGRVRDAFVTESRFVLYENGREYVGEWNIDRYCDLTLSVEVGGTYDGEVFLRQGRYAVLVGSDVMLDGARTHMKWGVKEVLRSNEGAEKEKMYLMYEKTSANKRK